MGGVGWFSIFCVRAAVAQTPFCRLHVFSRPQKTSSPTPFCRRHALSQPPVPCRHIIARVGHGAALRIFACGDAGEGGEMSSETVVPIVWKTVVLRSTQFHKSVAVAIISNGDSSAHNVFVEFGPCHEHIYAMPCHRWLDVHGTHRSQGCLRVQELGARIFLVFLANGSQARSSRNRTGRLHPRRAEWTSNLATPW